MPKVVDHEKYKQYVLEHCVDIFYKKGYKNITLKDIAKHLGVSVGSLYYYFPSKKHLFLDMNRNLQKKAKEEFHEILKDVKTPYKKIEKFLLTLLRNPTIVQKHAILLFDLVREDSSQQVKKEVFHFIREFAINLQEELKVSFQDAQMILVFIAGLMKGNFMLKNKKFFEPSVNNFLYLIKKKIDK